MSESLATVGTVAAVAVGQSARPPLPGETRQRRDPAPPGKSGEETLPETRAAARAAMETEGRFQVRIHTETLRVITEVVDTITGDVLMYLPPGYRPDSNPQAKAEETDSGGSGS
jgi:hypothetical protein